MNDIILIGGGGHCKSVIDVIEQEGKFKIAGIVDKPDLLGSKVLGYSVIGNDSDLSSLVNKYQYGIRLPVTKFKLVEISNPERGDVVVFRYPGNEKINFIKRVVGIPGDIVRYEDKNLYVNNIKYKKVKENEHMYINDFFREEIDIFTESNKTKSYNVLNDNMSPSNDDTFKVPKGKYFVMGDNRDHSSDSRYWGFVPNENLVGKAFLIWMSFNSNNYSLKYKRIGNSIK